MDLTQLVVAIVGWEAGKHIYASAKNFLQIRSGKRVVQNLSGGGVVTYWSKDADSVKKMGNRLNEVLDK